jgi:hypothetical protein
MKEIRTTGKMYLAIFSLTFKLFLLNIAVNMRDRAELQNPR